MIPTLSQGALLRVLYFPLPNFLLAPLDFKGAQLPLGLRGCTQTGMFSDLPPAHYNHSCMPNETSPSQSHAAKNELRCRLLGDLDHGAWCIRGTDDSTLVMDSPVPLKHHDPDILER